MRLVLTIAAALLAAPALASGDHAGHDMDHMDDTSRFGAAGDPAKADRTVTITATEIAYDVSSIDVKAGETIVFVLKNDGSQDHELAVGDDAFFAAHAKMMEAMPDMTHDMANMVKTKPGESARFAWAFTKPGTFKFGCSIPGHMELGMVGTVTVK